MATKHRPFDRRGMPDVAPLLISRPTFETELSRFRAQFGEEGEAHLLSVMDGQWRATDPGRQDHAPIVFTPSPQSLPTSAFGIERAPTDALTIDCAASPSVPDGWELLEHQSQDPLIWTPDAARLHRSPNQMDGKVIKGEDLLTELKKEKIPFLNACVLDYLFANQNLIPETWKQKGWITFWGTIYRHADSGRVVRCLYWRGERWYRHANWLEDDWYDRYPAVVRAT